MNDYIIYCETIKGIEVRSPLVDTFQNPQKIHIWLSQIDYPEDVILELRQFLKVDEITKSEKFHFEADRRRYTVSHAMLRIILSRYLRIDASLIEIDAGNKQKPFLLNPPKNIQFNLSHSGKFAAVAISFQNPVGIDIEEIVDFDYSGIVNTYFNIKEQKIIKIKNSKINFFKFWTMKEALLKASGIGLINNLWDLDMSGEAIVPDLLIEQYPGWFNHNFFIKTFEVGADHILSLASIRSNFEFECFRFDPFLLL